jgi:hypothetical protein
MINQFREMFSPQTVALGTALGFLITGTYAGAFLRTTYLLAVLSAITVAALATMRGAILARWKLNPSVLLIVLVASCVATMDLHSRWIAGDKITAISGFILFVETVIISSMLPMAFGFNAKRHYATLIIGLGIYVAANLFAYRTGITGVHGADEISADSISSGYGQRAIMPFSSGINSFGTLASICLSVCFLTLELTINSRNHLSTALALAVAGMSVYGVYLTETRMGIAVALVSLAWVFPLGLVLRKLLYCAVVAAFVAGAMIYTLLFFHTELPSNAAALIPSAFQRYGGDIEHLGGRVFMWGYGLDQIGAGELPLSGFGIAVRDAAPAIAAAGMDSVQFRMSFHNGIIDMLMTYGIPLTLMFVIGIVAHATISINGFKSLPSEPKAAMRHGFALIIPVFSASILEATTGTPVFWGILLSGVAYPVILSRSRDVPNQGQH